MMQHKYNMALQHFYQAAVTNNKAKPNSASDSSEEELFTDYYKEECFEIQEIKTENKNTSNKRKHSSKPMKQIIQPKSICSCRSCVLLLIVFILFLILVCSLTYFLQLGISQIVPVSVQNSVPLDYYHNFTTSSSHLQSCSGFKVEQIWRRDFEKLQTDSSTRLVDTNKDGIDDIIMGFGTSLDGYDADQVEICSKYYNNKFPCFGGVLSVDGKTGDQLWVHYSHHNIFGINCNGDLDADGVADCLCAGRGGVFEAISGATGSLLWIFLDKKYHNQHASLYTPQFINDINNDGVLDVVQIQGGDFHIISFNKTNQPSTNNQPSPTNQSSPINQLSKVLFFCGKTGNVLKAIPIPENAESNFSPVLYSTKVGELRIVFGTGSENQAGSLYVIPLEALFNEDLSKLIVIFKGGKKGFINSPVLVDINKDGVVDLISAGLNEKVIAIDGETLEILWTYNMTGAETYSLPAVGFYNNDDIVDFVIRKNVGTGFPVYYISKILILNGKTGEELPDSFRTSSATHSSLLSVSMEGYGNDLLLYWSSECEKHNQEKEFFQMVAGTDLRTAYYMDSCMARFNSKSFTKLSVMNIESGFPGPEIYNSKNSTDISNNSVIQSMFQTGVIGRSLSSKREKLSESFDIIFAVYDIKPSLVRIVQAEDLVCINDLKERAKKGDFHIVVDVKSNNAKGIYDHGDTAVNDCLQSRYNGTVLDDVKNTFAKNFNKGVMTLYRFQVTCECEKGKKCAKVLPQQEQGWAGYMGSMSNGYFNNRKSSSSS